MKISVEQLKKVAENGGSVTPDADKVDTAVIRLTDSETIARVTRNVAHMPDREDMIAELKAKIDKGEYNVSGDNIADAMIRRHIADQVK